jgi:hypothetical protein
MRIGILSEKYEGGGPATVSTGYGDSGGVSYGTYQLATNTGSAAAFVEWLQTQPDGLNAGAMLAQFEPGSDEFSEQWRWLADNRDELADLQDRYVKPRYYYAAVEHAKDEGLTADIPDALQCVLFSNAIQHGPYWAGRLLAESYDPDPATWITNIYDTKLSDLSWSSGAPTLRPGLFNRWENEKLDALMLLSGGEID